MNRYQKILLIVALVNIAVVLMFPPFDALPLARSSPRSFDGFFYVFGYHDNHTLNKALLNIEVFLVMINMLVAWLLLQDAKSVAGSGDLQRMRRLGIVTIMAGNLAIMLLFPPFETYASITHLQLPTFDSFYFVFGDKSRRNFFIPILYMEVSFVLINGALFSLLFGESDHAQSDLTPEQIAALARGLSPEMARKLAKDLQQQVLLESLKKPRPLQDDRRDDDRRKKIRESKLEP